MERVFVIVCALLVTARAGPLYLSADSDSCSRACTDRGKFNYAPGRTYNYQYDSDIKTTFQGASEDQAVLHLAATVQLEIISKCEINMRLDDVTLTEYDPNDATMKEVSSEFKAGLEKYPVRMSYQDGGIDEICQSGPEPVWVMNAKRGIISLIQNNMHDFESNRTVTETDVSGVCDTEYFVRETGWYKTSIGKSKNLLGCTDRQGYNSAIQGVPYTAQSNIQSLPLLKSDHNCVHEIDKQGGFLKSAKCTEQHMFRPFSKSDSGAVTVNTQTLTYISSSSAIKAPVPITGRVSLKFEHVHDVNAEGWNRKDITRKLTEICEKTKSGVRPETPRLFTDLVYLMKSADVDTLSDIYKMLTEEKICRDNLSRTRKYFLDALPMTGTSASVHMITELITSQVITGVEADMWLTTLSFIKNPTKDMLKEVKPLINSPDHSEKALLSVGTLVHSYCLHHGNCENDDLVDAIISAFTNKMAKGCKVSPDNMKSTLMALRGLGNAGYATSAVKTLSLCMRLQSNPIEIRLSAIEAFRRMPCDSNRVALMSLLQDQEEDSEIRIAAYRVLMECPSDKVLAVVRNTLAKEEVNQVGSYIWTHLTNLMETSDRHKQDIRALLEDETFKKEFDMDKRKFSRNYEGSLFIERLNTGAKVEGDMIWSSKSFIPRSAMMNLTFDLFGHSVNLFEFGGRAEGLEYFFESLFGPNGYFRDAEKDAATSDVVPKNIRGDKIKKIDKRFNAQMADLRGSLYMRVFGNELRYMNFKGMDSLLTGPDFNILDLLIKLSEDNDYTYSQSTMFMDSSYIVPTSSGFPLNLTVNGTAMVDLKMKGKMDLRHPPTLNIDGLIQPSAAIDISSMMSVDAFVTKSGIKMVSTLHTSTAIQGKITVDEKGSITTEYEMPEPRMEIIDVKSSFFTVHRDMEREQKMISENRQTLAYCSPEKIVTITGLELCAEVAYPNASIKSEAPYFPLTGPATAGVYLYNRDTHVKYRMEAKSLHNRDKNIVHFTFDTPNSRINRHVEIDFSLNKRDLTLDASLVSPWKTANLQGTVTNTRKLIGLSGKMDIDGKTPYSLDAQLGREGSGNTFVYKPSIVIQANKDRRASISGMFSVKNWKRIDVQIDAEGIWANPISAKLAVNNKDVLMGLQGSLDVAKNKQYSFDVNMATTAYKKKVLYKPLVSVRTPAKEVVAFGGGVTYVFGKGLDINLVLDKIVDKKITLTGKLMKAVKRRRSIFNTKLDFRSSPADFSVKAKFDKRSMGTLTSDIDFTYVIRRIARNNIKLVSKIINQSTKSLTRARANMNLEVKRNPELNLKLLTDISHNKKHTELNGDLWYGQDFKDDEKHMEMRLEMNRNLKSLMEASADVQTRLRVPALDFVVMMEAAHSHDERNLNSNFTFKFGKGQPVETSLQVHDKTEKLLKVDADYKLSFPGYNIGIDHALEQTTDDRYISTLKTQMKKGQENVIQTTITPNGRKFAINSDVKLYAKNPVKLQGEFGFDPNDFISSISYESDINKYAASLSSATEMGKSSWLLFDIHHPARHVIISLKGNKIDEMLTGGVELQLNKTKIFSINAWFEEPRPEKLNGSVTLNYPSRTLILNAHHTKGSKYSSHADFTWEPAKTISIDNVLSITRDAVIGSVKMSSPFKTLPKLDIETKLTQDSEQYNTDASITLEGSKTISLISELKKPISFKTLVGSLSLRSPKNPFFGIKSVTLNVNHKLSSSMASSVRLGWNKQFVQTDVILQNTTKGTKMGIYGSVDIKTSFQYMKKGKLVLSHDNNGRTFNTNINLNRNKRAYKMVSKITHQPSDNYYANTGLIKIFSPMGSSDTSWNHRHGFSNIATSLASSWGKNKKQTISAKLISDFEDSFSATFDLQTPFSTVKDTKLQISYTKKEMLLNGQVDIRLNGNKIGSAEVTCSTDEEKSSAGLAIVIPDLDVNTNFNAELNFPLSNEMSGSVKATLTPRITMSLEGTTKVMKSGSLAHTIILWKSSFPGYEQVRYTYELLADDSITTITKLEYGEGNEIKLETKFGYEPLDKHASAVLTTPFKSLEKLQGGVSFRGNLDSFKSDIFIEYQPLFEKTSANLSWETKTGLISSLRVDMPIPEYPYFQADLSGVFSNSTSELDIKIEYRPKVTVHLAIDHKQSGSDMTISAKAISPLGMISFQHDGKPRDFKCTLMLEDLNAKTYGIDIVFSHAAKMEGLFTISTPWRRDISVLFSHIGDAYDFKTHTEIQHNRKNSFVSDLSLSIDDMIKMALSGSLRTELISDTEEYEAAFNLDGSPMKFSTHGEMFTTSLGKSQTDISFDMTDSYEGNLVIKSPMMRNIKASFKNFLGDNFMQSDAYVIHGGNKIVEIQASLNRRDSVIGALKLKTPLSEDIALSTRFDGELKRFSVRSEGSYGDKKADIDISSIVNSYLLQQKISFSATDMNDMSVEINHSGDLSTIKSFGELNIGQDRHRADLMFSNTENKEGSISLESPIIDPATIKFQLTGTQNDFKSRGELKLASDTSSVDLSFTKRDGADISMNIDVKSPFIEDVTLSLNHENKLLGFDTVVRISIEGMDDSSLKMSSSLRPLTFSLAITTPFDNFTNFDTSFAMTEQGRSGKSVHFDYTLIDKNSEVDIYYSNSDKYTGQLSVKSHFLPDSSISFEHEGKLRNFKSRAEYSFGDKISEIDIIFSGLSRYEGLITINSHLVPSLSAGFEHDGTLKQFRSHGEYSVGFYKRELDASVNVENDIDIQFKYKCPEHGTSTATFTHTGSLKDFRCHAEVTSAGKWEGDMTFSTNSKIQGKLSLTPPPFSRFEPLMLTFEHSGATNKFRSQGEFVLGDDKIRNELYFATEDQILSAGLTMASTYFKDLSFNLRSEGEPKHFKLHADALIGSNKLDSDFTLQLTKSSLMVSSKLISPMWDDIEADLNINGMLTKFSASAYVKVDRNENTGALTFTNTANEIACTIDIKSRYMDAINLNLRFTGELAKFTTEYDSTIAGRKNKALIDLNLKDTIYGKVSIDEPKLSVEGSLKDGAVSISTITQDGEYSFVTTYYHQDSVKISCIVKTPYDGYRNMHVLYEHTGTLRNFRCNGKLTIEQEESIFSSVADTRDVSNIEFGFHLTSPYLQSFEIKFSRRTEVEKYIYDTELSIDNQKVFGILVSSINDNVTGVKHIGVYLITNGVKQRIFEIESDANGFQASSEISLGTEIIHMHIVFSKEPQLKLTGSLTYFFNTRYGKSLKANLNFEENQGNYAGNYEFLWDDKKVQNLMFTLNTNDQISGSIVIHHPVIFQDKYGAEFSLNSGERVFDFDAKVTRDSINLFQVIFSLDIKNGQQARFILTSNEPHPLSATFSFTNNNQNYKIDWDLTHDTNSLLNGNADITIKTQPFFVDGSAKHYTRTTASSFRMHVDPTEKLFRSNSALTVNKDTWSLYVQLDAKNNVDASVNVKIPQMEEIGGTVTHLKRTYRSKTDVEIKFNSTHKIEYDMEMKWRNGLDLIMSLKTPFEGFGLTTFKGDFEGSFPNIKSSAGINIANTPITGSVVITHTDSTKADFTLTTPFESFENLALNVYRDGDLSNFKTGGRLMYTVGEEIEVDIEHSWIGMTQESKARLMSPFTDAIIISANHSGMPSDFSSGYEFSVGSDLKYISKTNMKTGANFLVFTNTLTSVMNGESFVQRIELKHDGSLDKFKTEALVQSLGYVYRFDTSFQLEPDMEGSVEIITPFENFKDMKASFSYTGSSSGFLTVGEIKYAPMKKISGKINLLQYGWRRLTANVELRTPFENMELNKLTYRHSGDSESFECELDSNIARKTVTGTLTASTRNINIDIGTNFKGFESFGFSGKYLKKSKNQQSLQMETKLNPDSRIVVETSYSLSPSLSAELSVSSPFRYLKDFSAAISHKQLAKGYMESLKITHNNNGLVDFDIDHNSMEEHKHVLCTVRAPRPMKFELEGDFTTTDTDFDLTANWNTDDRDSNLRLETGYDVSNEKRISAKLTYPGLPGKILSFNGLLKERYSKADVAWGMRQTEKAGYEVTLGDYDGKVKLILPERSLIFAGSQRGTVTEGSFMWDADVDGSKKVGFKSQIVTAKGVAKADITIMMPSLGKNVKVGSEILVNQGQVIFDGKTVLSYSGDSRKNIVFTTKLEDISIASSKNYSFSFGVSHPYTTVGVTVNSHAGKSNTGYSAGVGLEYLTIRKQTKKFQIGARIDKLKKSISFELQSPVKSVSISGSVQTNDKFRVSLLNVYDQRQPLHTHLTFDAATRSIDFVANFDLDNPRDEFHVNSKYVNSSAVATEVFHIVRGNRVTDVLLTARLNNSHLLHSRLHWRPTMFDDLQEFIERKAIDYNRRLHSAAARIEPEIVEEVVEKFRNIWGTVSEEIGEENIAKFEAAVVPVLGRGLRATIAMSMPLLQQLRERVMKSNDVTAYLEHTSIPKPIKEVEMQDFDTEALDYVRGLNSDVFNTVFAQIKLPAKHVPGYVTSIMTHAVEKMPVIVSSQIKSFQLLEALESMVREELIRVEEELEEKLSQLEEIVKGHMKSPFTVYDPEHGEIQMELYSLIPLQSLDKLPVINFIKYVRAIEKLGRLKKSFTDRIPEIGMPDFTAELVPPFTGVASITGGHRITTYDGNVYDLNRDCTYMLTRDYTDGNFSLILSNDGYTTLTILTPGKPISINIQEEILVDAKPATLPFTEGYVTVTQNEGGIVTVKGGNHFSIDYDLTIDHMTIKISGWYHGKTGGLLGVYDNEPGNDLMTSFNKVVDNSARFAKTWDVGTNSCR